MANISPPEALDSEDRVLIRALRYEPRGRGELSESTGWSRNTVASRLARLIDAGWLVELDDTQGERGRPFTRYGLNPLASYTLAARFSAESVKVALTTLDGQIVTSERHALDEPPGPDGAMRELDAMLERLTAENNIPRALIRTMIVGVPGPVSGMSRTVPWSKVGVLPPDLATRFSMRVAIENDANLMALGAQLDNRDVQSMLFLLVDTGIGAGVILSGRLHRGLDGWAGEIGHIPVAAAGDKPCSCGNRGCLASVASNPALKRMISTPERPVDTVEDLRQLVLAGDTAAIMALREAGRNVGEAITGLIVGLAPELITIGGHVARIDDHVIAGIRETLAQRTPPRISSQLQITATPDHNIAAIRGAAELAFDLLFPAPSANLS